LQYTWVYTEVEPGAKNGKLACNIFNALSDWFTKRGLVRTIVTERAAVN
jgi:hypothetical protein